jgi:hypothetical protein
MYIYTPSIQTTGRLICSPAVARSCHSTPPQRRRVDAQSARNGRFRRAFANRFARLVERSGGEQGLAAEAIAAPAAAFTRPLADHFALEFR